MDPNLRRLAAVWFADIVGFTRLSSSDERAAVRLVALFQQTARAATAAHGGRVVNFIGDAALAEFNSTDAAMKAAVRLQRDFATQAAAAGIDACLRIGVHVGDVVQSPDGDLFGDGVNTAARLQEIARPCQIVCSQDVWRHLRPRGEFGFDSLGERQLQGITGRVWAFSVHDPIGAAELGSRPLPVGRAALARWMGLGRALLAYVVAAIITYQLVVALSTRLAMPEWVPPLALALLAVGLLVMIVTGWVQTRPTWERSVQQKAPWALDLPEAVDALRNQRLPELTWPRALVGGVVAFALLFALALGYVYLSDAGRMIGPRRAAAEPGLALAILPFETRGDEMGVWRQGVPDLLGLFASGAGLRVIDPIAVMSRAADHDGLEAREAARNVGQGLSARYALTGTAEARADSVRLTASLFDVRSGRLVRQVAVEGSADSVAALAGQLAAGVLQADLVADPDRLARLDLGRLATRSPEALHAFLLGEQLYRRSRWTEAQAAFAEAVSADPHFAFALYRLSLTSAWARYPHEPQRDDRAEEALLRAVGLPERHTLLIRAHAQATRRSGQAVATLRELTTKYPDDVEGWFLLGDAYYHGLGGAAPADSFRAALRRGLELDSSFGPAYLHLIEDAAAGGDIATVDSLIAAYRRTDPGSPLLRGFDLARAVMPTQPAQATAAPPATDTAPAPRSTAPSPRAAERAAERAGYDALLRVASTARTDAVRAGADGARLGPGDALRARADGAARQGRFTEGEQLLEQARAAYEDARAGALWVARLDSMRSAITPVRNTVRSDVLRTEGETWETRAAAAQADGRYIEALQDLERALRAYRTPPPAPVAQPATPGPAPADERPAIEAALGRIARAIEGEDISALLALWPSLDAQERENFRVLFAGTREIRVVFDTRSIEVEGDAATASLLTTYHYYNESTRAPDSATFAQVLVFSRRNGEWVVTGSR